MSKIFIRNWSFLVEFLITVFSFSGSQHREYALYCYCKTTAVYGVIAYICITECRSSASFVEDYKRSCPLCILFPKLPTTTITTATTTTATTTLSSYSSSSTPANSQFPCLTIHQPLSSPCWTRTSSRGVAMLMKLPPSSRTQRSFSPADAATYP